jgi:hypothetical protein
VQRALFGAFGLAVEYGKRRGEVKLCGTVTTCVFEIVNRLLGQESGASVGTLLPSNRGGQGGGRLDKGHAARSHLPSNPPSGP